MPRRLLLPLAALLAALAAAPAHASTRQTMSFEAPKDLLGTPEATRQAALDRIGSLGVRALRVVLYWRDVAPAASSPDKPDFDTTDPANYDWSKYDPALQAAKARGWKILLTVTGPVPRWSTLTRKDQYTRPDPDEFAQFMTAVGRKYGSVATQWSIWNEPNQNQFLKPQYEQGKPVSPLIYRELYGAGLRGLASANVRKPQVLIAETSPIGNRPRVVSPLVFLRGMLCLDTRYRRAKACGKLASAGYAHHAYPTKSGPLVAPEGADDVTIAVLPRLTRAIDRAAKAGALPARLPVYLTEFGIQSVPDQLIGVSLQRQAEYRAIAERIAYDNPRVRAFSQYLLRDDDPKSGETGIGKYPNFESGLQFAKGQDKPSLAAFRLPLAVRRSSGARASLWGLVRPATKATKVTLQRRGGARGAWTTIRTITTSARGTWRLTSTPAGATTQFRVLWAAPDGQTYDGTPIRGYR